ncbi:MAG: HEAT repeat domain-containing protein [Candidatus Helarchaeota archaeon]
MAKFEELNSILRKRDTKLLKSALEQLGDLGDVRAVPHLLALLDTEQDSDIIEAILWTLSRIAPSKTLIQLLRHHNEKIVIEALDALGRRQAKEAVDEIIPFLKHKNDEIRALATWALGKLCVDKTYDLFIDLLMHDEDPEVRAHAAWAIGKFERPDSISVLNRIKSQEPDEYVQYNLAEAIEHIESTRESQRKGVATTIYECPKYDPYCRTRERQTEILFDKFVRIEIIKCETCPFAQICRVNLTKYLGN